MTRTIADDCDGDVSAADTEGPKVGRVSLHAEGCELCLRIWWAARARGISGVGADGDLCGAEDVLASNFHFLSRHFHSSKLQKPLAFSLAKSTIAFNGRVIFQKERAE
jgi:hypothetical protein